MKKNLKTFIVATALVVFSKPIAMCFLIVGDIILSLNQTISNLF